MNFRTRIDNTNRQVKQYEQTELNLSGSTTFGLPYSALTTGPNLTTTGITFSDIGIVSTFSGNSSTTNYVFGDSRMEDNAFELVPLTPANSGTTQETGPNWVGYNMFTTVDGYTGYTDYSAVTYDVLVDDMFDLGGGAYSGNVESSLYVYSASSLDYTGSTIWVDVSGITRTKRLIISDTPNIGYVFTCLNSEGEGVWLPASSGGTGGVYSFTNGLTESGGTVSLGGTLSTDTTIEASGNTLNILNTGVSEKTQMYIDNTGLSFLHFSDIDTNQSILRLDKDNGSSFSLRKDDLNVGLFLVEGFGSSKPYLHLQTSGGALDPSGNAISMYFKGDGGLYLTDTSNTLDNYIAGSLDGTLMPKRYIVSGITEIHNNYLNLSGGTVTGDFKVSSLPSVSDLQTNLDGQLIDGASDKSLKNNVKPITNPLETILKLNPVSFEWVPEIRLREGNVFGLIAQEVKEVLPDIVRERANGKGTLTLEYKELIPWIIGAIKELSVNKKINAVEETILKTQTILAEDNNIELNYNGNAESAVGGGITVLHTMSGGTNSEIKTNSDGDWVFNPPLKTEAFIPSSTYDSYGHIGMTTYSDDYIYIKTNNGWKRTSLENF